jgi:hypothetical protein
VFREKTSYTLGYEGCTSDAARSSCHARTFPLRNQSGWLHIFERSGLTTAVPRKVGILVRHAEASVDLLSRLLDGS